MSSLAFLKVKKPRESRVVTSSVLHEPRCHPSWAARASTSSFQTVAELLLHSDTSSIGFSNKRLWPQYTTPCTQLMQSYSPAAVLIKFQLSWVGAERGGGDTWEFFSHFQVLPARYQITFTCSKEWSRVLKSLISGHKWIDYRSLEHDFNTCLVLHSAFLSSFLYV